MIDAPVLTILMPAYNAAKYVNEAVDSLLKQTFLDFELWIVDDASTDYTVDILRRYRDSRVKIFTNPVNTGRDAIVNHYVSLITSAFFTVTDADDVSMPTRLQKQMELMQKDSDLLMCGTSYYAMDAQGFVGRYVSLFADPSVIRSQMMTRAQFHGPTTIMRREVIDLIKPLYRSGYFGAFADADLCARIVILGKAVNLSDPLYLYRIVENSMSRKNITPESLTYYKVISWLYEQRLKSGTDVIESGDELRLNEYKQQVISQYGSGYFLRHLAFNQLYWGLLKSSFINSWKALMASPWDYRIALSTVYINLNVCFFSVERAFTKVHYKNYR